MYNWNHDSYFSVIYAASVSGVRGEFCGLSSYSLIECEYHTPFPKHHIHISDTPMAHRQ